MKQLIRQPGGSLSGYAALGLFAVAYLATIALVIAPEQVKAAFDSPVYWTGR